ncbi:VOC family protein [Chloroflexota bacterium]
MVPTSPAKIKVSAVQQVCLVVKDLQKTIEAYWNILGIGPWAIFESGSPEVTDLKYHGKQIWSRHKVGVSQAGLVELELIEPLYGPSVYQDWIDEHGEGLHHCKFLVKDLNVDRTVAEMEAQGFPCIFSMHWGENPRIRSVYFDTAKPLRCIWETSNRTGGIPQGATIYPEDPAAVSPAKVKVAGVKQIAIAVKDVVQTAENYWNIMGIGPWEIREWGSHALYDRAYYGKPAWARERLGHAYIGDLEIELVQPIEGDSLYQDWIDEHGEGLHHLKFLCDDIDGVSKALTEQGFTSIQNGHFGDPKMKAGGFNYIDIPPLHCIWEPVHKLKTLPMEPNFYVPPR